MNFSFFGSHGGLAAQEKEEKPIDTEDDYDPNEESLSQGDEYIDDAIRIIEQPFHQHTKS